MDNNKFKDLITSEFEVYDRAIADCNILTQTMGATIYEIENDFPLLTTIKNFTRIAYETPRSIIHLLYRGYLAQSVVLLRWYLEMSQLCDYLIHDKEGHTRWLAGEQIRPWAIGVYRRNEGYPDWKAIYEDWSDLVHGNASKIEEYDKMSPMTPISDTKKQVLEHILFNLSILHCHFNYIFAHFLKENSTQNIRDIIIAFNKLEERLLKLPWQVKGEIAKVQQQSN